MFPKSNGIYNINFSLFIVLNDYILILFAVVVPLKYLRMICLASLISLAKDILMTS